MKFPYWLRRALFTANLFSTAACVPLAAQLAKVQVHESATEIVVSANFLGGGFADLVLIDRSSGAYRLGEQTAAGVFTWHPPRAGGIADVTAVAAGQLLSASHYALVVGSADANRLHVLDLTQPHPPPLPVYVPLRLGPVAVASGQIGGSSAFDDLVVATHYNNPPNPYSLGHYVFDPVGPSLSVPAAGSIIDGPDAYEQLRRVAISAALPEDQTIAYLVNNGVSACVRVVSLATTTFPLLLNVCGLDPQVRYEFARFGGATLAGLLTYIPGEMGFSYRPLSVSGSGFSAGAVQNFTLPIAVGHVVPVLADGTVRLAIRSLSGDRVLVYDFNGSVLSPPLQQLNAPPGSAFAVLAPTVGGPLQAFSRDLSSGQLLAAHAYTWPGGGSGFGPASVSALAPLSNRAGMANVSLMSAEPFVDASARPVTLRNTRDWTSGAAPVLPGPVNVTAEAFLSEPQGLGDPLPVSLGASPSGASYALLNQYADAISVFTLSRASGSAVGQVGISPAAGLYDRSIELRFSSLPDGLLVLYRDLGGVWTLFTDPGPEPELSDPAYASWFAEFSALVRYKETTIEYFGVDGAGRVTPLRRAHFRFTEAPDSLSTLGDGVPDYAKLGSGLNPFRLPDGDAGAGVGNALQALLSGSGLDARRLAGSAVDVYVRPLSHDGDAQPSTPSRIATNPLQILPDGTAYAGNQIFARSMGGALIGQGRDPIAATPERNEGLGIYPGAFSDPAALLTNLSGEDSGLYIISTRPNFALPDPLPSPPLASSTGRELIGLLSLQGVTQTAYTRSYGGDATAVEAVAWVSGAISHYAATPPPVVLQTLDSLETLAALLFERWLQLRMLERGLLDASYTPTLPDAVTPPGFNENYLTLSGYRSREGARPMNVATAGALSPIPESLRELGQWSALHPAYSLARAAEQLRDAARTSASAEAVALREVALDVYRISAAHGNVYPGLLDPPIDVLRRFIATGALPDAYGPLYSEAPGAPFTTITLATYVAAVDAIDQLLSVPQPRQSQWIQVEFRADSLDYPGCLVVEEAFAPGVLYSVFNGDGQAFRLPASFDVLPGARMHLNVFTDAPFSACMGTPLEVIESAGAVMAEVTVLPLASAEDGDGNLLGDDWEQAFFGSTGVDPWLDMNGDGYVYLQKYLDGKDPFMPLSYTANPAAYLALPVLTIESPNPAEIVVSWQFPDAYAALLNFQVLEDPTLGGTWAPAPYVITNPAPNQYAVTIPYPATTPAFWQIGLSLP